MQDAGYKPGVRVFRSPGRSSVLGVGLAPVPGTRFQVPDSRYPILGTRYRVPAFEKPAHGVCRMQDKKGSDPGYPVPGTWYLTPMPHSLISNLNRALLL
jgi:hypothetical protein